MLTFVLLVVLAVGVGLIAVFAAEEEHLATEIGERRRETALRKAARRRRTQDAGPLAPPDPESEAVLEPDTAPTEAAGVAPQRHSLRRVRSLSAPEAQRIPKAYIAVEGPFEDVAGGSLARRALSLMAIAVIVVAMGVGSAAVLGALFGAIGEMLDSAIG